ncbi:MAG: hypothetical protein HY831_00245 [Candidatus Aenigmarchaeota archaeon]|nr:hypothetical protein [Candidatus Aenigmarchaeota archaeon]
MNKMKITKDNFDPKKHVAEFKRTCNQCKKIWHSLANREKKIKDNINVNNWGVIGNCCGDKGAAYQAKRNVEANQTELDKIKKCPKCSSADYKEEPLYYEKKL